MNKKGLTLVEMLLVVVLIAVIGLIVLPNISKMLNNFCHNQNPKW